MQATIVERAIQGDEEAFAHLVSEVGDRLLAIAYRIVRDLGRAEDAVQISLVSAWRDLPMLRDPSLFETHIHPLDRKPGHGR